MRLIQNVFFNFGGKERGNGGAVIKMETGKLLSRRFKTLRTLINTSTFL